MNQEHSGYLRNWFRKIYLYTRRHADFLIVDMVSFILAYGLALLIRRAMNIPIYRGNLVIKYGFVAAFVYLIGEYFTQNLNGILFRGLGREAERLAVQIGVSWSIFTVILYLHQEAHEFSRSIYLIALVTCFVFILTGRTLWKMLLRYSRLHEKNAPFMMIVCEKRNAQTVLNRLLPGSFGNFYRISGLVLTDRGEMNYNDWYPCVIGLEKTEEAIRDWRVQDAYVELANPQEEARIIRLLLNAGVTVHRSLGESKIDYLSQRIDYVGGKSVITIEDARSSLAGRLDELIRATQEKRARKKLKDQEKE